MYELGCMMAFVRVPNWNEVVSQIDHADVYTNPHDESFGIETEPHVTILYGLHDTIPDGQIHTVANQVKPIEDIQLTGISAFEAENYDVLKFDVESAYLRKLNKVFKKFPYTTNFPDYNPHLTVAYLQSGTWQKYEHLSDLVDPIVDCTSIVYSKPSGEKHFFLF